MKIAIIGGGAAGMIAALAAKGLLTGIEERFAAEGKPFSEGEPGAPEVILFEKNDNLGVKVLLSGGGRCNVTTGLNDIKKVLDNYPRGAKFLRTAMYAFSPQKVIYMFGKGGVKMKTEEDNRVFPASNDGKSVVGFLEDRLKDAGVELILKEQVLIIEKDGEGFSIRTRNAKEYKTDKVILATGGSAYKQTGSTGDGYTFAEKMGHTITPLAPSLGALILEPVTEGILGIKGLPAGVSFPKVALRLELSGSGGKTFQRTGPVLFTHTGITGPAVFALSAMTAYEKIDKANYGMLYADFFPDESAEILEKRLLEFFDGHGKKQLINILDMIMPNSFCDLFLKVCELSGSFPADLRGAEIGREQRKIIIKNLKAFPSKVTGRFAGEEFVTAGGVSLDQVDHKTMQSKIVPGLYFAGEILDVDGFTGGFNLQAAWATGYLAGRSAAV